MASIIRSIFGGKKGESSTDPGNQQHHVNAPVSAEPCTSCIQPCSYHAQLPASLASKIDQESPLIGSVKPYQFHILLCSVRQDFTKWPSHLDEESDHIVHFVTAKLEKIGLEKKWKDHCSRIMVTLVTRKYNWEDGVDETEDYVRYDDTTPPQQEDAADETYEIILLPTGHCFPKMTRQNVSDLLEHLSTLQLPDLLNKRDTLPPFPSPSQNLSQTLVLVCAHKLRDKRCGVAGPLIVNEFHTYLANHHHDAPILVYGVSHTGGHKFAGNVIIYCKTEDNDNKNTQLFLPNWFGRVIPCHVEKLVEETCLKGLILKDIWRGGMVMKGNGDVSLEW